MSALIEDLLVAADPVEVARRTGIELDDWQQRFLRSHSDRVLLNCSRQSGKSTMAAVHAVHTALYDAGSLTLLVSPSERQSGELAAKVRAEGREWRVGKPRMVSRLTSLLETGRVKLPDTRNPRRSWKSCATSSTGSLPPEPRGRGSGRSADDLVTALGLVTLTDGGPGPPRYARPAVSSIPRPTRGLVGYVGSERRGQALAALACSSPPSCLAPEMLAVAASGGGVSADEHSVPFEDFVRLVILGVATVGGIAAFAAWREARTTQKMLRTLIGHQFKTPLSAVLSALYTAHDRRQEMPEEALSELLETAIAEAHELDRLMSGFLSLTGTGDMPERARFRRRSHRNRAPGDESDRRHLRSLD